VWTGLLAANGSRVDVILGIEASTEYRSLRIREMYATLLQRPAESEGLTAWLRFLDQGGTLEQVEAGFLASAEYFQARGGGTHPGYLHTLYRDLLGRTPDEFGRMAFLDALEHGASRQQVAEALFASEELRQSLTQGLYRLYLGRDAEPVGVAFWADRLRTHGMDDVIAGILGSEEFLGLLPKS